MKIFVSVLFSFFLVACGTFNPQSGMSFDQFKGQAGRSGKGGPVLVGMNGSVSVYYLNGMTDQNIFYWFDNGRLFKVSQGQLPVIRKQIEIINR